MSVSQRLYLIAFVPILMLTAFVIWTGRQSHADSLEAKASYTYVDNSLVIGTAVYSLQKERGLSAGYLATGGSLFWTDMLNQRQATDLAWMNLSDVAKHNKGRSGLFSGLSELRTEIRETRKQVADRNIGVDASTALYSDVITTLMEGSAVRLDRIPDLPLINMSNAYLAVIRAKEQAGLERAMGMVGFSAGRFEPIHGGRFLEYRSAQTDYLQTALDFTLGEQRQALTTLPNAVSFQRLEELRERADRNIGSGTQTDIPASVWWKASTAWVDTLHAEELQLAAALRTRAQYRVDGAAQRLHLSLAAGLVALFLSLGLAQIMIQTIRRQIAALGEALRQVLQGKSRVDVPCLEQGDEISQMAQTIDWLRTRNHAKETAPMSSPHSRRARSEIHLVEDLPTAKQGST